MKSRLTLELEKIVYDVLKRKIKTIGAEEFTCKGYPNELKEEIVSVVAKYFRKYARELVPEEMKYDETFSDDFRKGYNYCQQEILRRIEEGV